uniref:Kynurenine 3-monooxygenase n=1 Tax=Mucochytrium quahogii TaxID=96639 RepID=A0A7S2WFB3_9STRA|mmetsp:Transcript_19889/g.32713  ORF Transcript_19889/g.32713 Transcript_19889/m.32713 type:complete len:479 (-) Transcript_19889:78-1514(-)|eukprot:CAMPEP_0203784350 /NCGR_PEP_ID=MMETSP0100_2-20121128/413_1 /ASSEMBLY_ACC=CAM_ASM_000210 /TAXON_ID=96639 /ORGANISM=" , Strain NY0313808BC1" /LENGTH=478 /DNA_ID=CAMNT_0050686313 /DNA_START=190 /DNA_END=1626 /DNA_ORIENTATION=-
MVVVVVGGGPVGSLAALSFSRLGFKVKLVEKRPDFTSGNAVDRTVECKIDKKEVSETKDMSVAKRSINLALSVRGEKSLEYAGLAQDVAKLTIPMYGRAIHIGGEELRFQRYDETNSDNFLKSVSRELINDLILEKALADPNIEVVFGKQLLNLDKNLTLHFGQVEDLPRSATFNDCQEGTYQIKNPELVIGADGAYSAVRQSLLKLQTTDYTRRYITHGYKELHIKPHPETGDYQLDLPCSLHIWPRGEFMMIALPNLDKSFTCTVFAPMKELEALSMEKDIISYVDEHFPDIKQYMPDYVAQFKQNPTCRLTMGAVSPWNLDSRVILIGDAAHPMVPFYGQGMNCGMEDVLELVETLEASNLNLEKAIPKFAKTRAPRGDAIAQLSLRNYIEMRSHTSSRLFLLRKKVEGAINWVFPDSWIPLYKMVAFTRIPYDEVIRRDELQEKTITLTTNILLYSTLTAGIATAAVWFVSRSR